jgi:hypothetical protein
MADDHAARRHYQAAREALDRLASCIDYLDALGKKDVAKQLRTNHSSIRRNVSPEIRGRAPSQRARESRRAAFQVRAMQFG